MRAPLYLLLAPLVLAGCGENTAADDSNPDSGVDAGADGSTDAAADAIDNEGSDSSDAGGEADGSEEPVDPPWNGDPGIPDDEGVYHDPELPATHVLVADTILVGREVEPGIAVGFDLDGRVDTAPAPESCRQRDFTGVDGTPGVDNQFARLAPLIEAAGGQALEALVQQGINDGNLLIVFEIIGLDDLLNDDSVSINLMRGVGEPTLNADSRIAADQTFDIDPEAQYTGADGLEVVDGVLRVEGLEFTLPVYVFEYNFPMDITDSVIELTFHEDGTASGVLAGAVRVENVEYLADIAAINDDLRNLLINIVNSNADMIRNEEGKCEAFSVAFTFTTTTAFLFGDAPRPGLE